MVIRSVFVMFLQEDAADVPGDFTKRGNFGGSQASILRPTPSSAGMAGHVGALDRATAWPNKSKTRFVRNKTVRCMKTRHLWETSGFFGAFLRTFRFRKSGKNGPDACRVESRSARKGSVFVACGFLRMTTWRGFFSNLPET